MKRAKTVFESEGINVQPYPVDFKSDKSFSQSNIQNKLENTGVALNFGKASCV